MPLEEITIEEYTEEYRSQVVDLFRQEFTVAGGAVLDIIEETLEKKQAVIAIQKNELAGFGTYTQLNNRSDLKFQVQETLLIAKSPLTLGAALKSRLEIEQVFHQNGELVLEFFDSKFSRGDFCVLDSDISFTSMVVPPKYQRQGLGRLLIRERVKIAKDKGASAIYVSCWEGGPSKHVYSKEGFEKIIRYGPAYPDGQAVTAMGLVLD